MHTDFRPHISVCICTYRRNRLLQNLLQKLEPQETHGLFTYSLVVVDNDAARSAEEIVEKFRQESALDVTYAVEPQQNIALARNMAVKHAKGDFIAFIDDDEFPIRDWLLQLFRASERCAADGALGPVLPEFDGIPPAWIKRGGFCDRPSHPTGMTIDWTQGRTGNLLFLREILDGVEPVFRAEFGGGGEDRDFFRRMISTGRKFVWCEEAPVYEWIPPVRWKRSVMIRRALLRGKMSLHHDQSVRGAFKSFFAVVGYGLALPVSWILGHHWFMKFLIKGCEHAGKLLALIGINPIRQKYILD